MERAAHTGVGWAVAMLGAGLALLAAFAAVERRSPEPLLARTNLAVLDLWTCDLVWRGR